jgi:hypothetical protein
LNPKLRDDIALVEMDSEVVIYDRAEDGLYHMNPSAGIVLQLCDGTGTIDEIARDISEVGGMPFDEVLEQVDGIVRHFEGIGVLEGSPSREERERAQAQADYEGHAHPEDAHDHEDHSGHAHAQPAQDAQDEDEDAPTDPTDLETQDTQNH